METGTFRIHTDCPACGRPFRISERHAGRSGRCPDCGAAFTVPLIEPLSARPTEPSRWPNRWAIVWGAALLLAVLLPRPVASRGPYSSSGQARQIEWVFYWEEAEKAGPGDRVGSMAALGFLTLIVVGLLSIIAGRTMRGTVLGHTLLWVGLGVFALNFLLARTWPEFSFYPDDPDATPIVVMLILLATSAIAAGNHVRKFRPYALAPRILVGIGGVVLVLGLLVPVFEERALIGWLLERELWDDRPAVAACCVAFVIFALLSLSSFLAGEILRINLTLSTIERCLMIGFPVVVLVTITTTDREANFGILFFAMTKFFVSLYALLAIVAVGLAAMNGAGSKVAEP